MFMRESFKEKQIQREKSDSALEVIRHQNDIFARPTIMRAGSGLSVCLTNKRPEMPGKDRISAYDFTTAELKKE